MAAIRADHGLGGAIGVIDDREGNRCRRQSGRARTPPFAGHPDPRAAMWSRMARKFLLLQGFCPLTVGVDSVMPHAYH